MTYSSHHNHLNNLFIELSPEYTSKSTFITKKMKTDYGNYDKAFNAQSSSDSDTSVDDGENLFKSIRGFLIFGKVIGLLPFSGVFGSSWKNLSFRKTSPTALISYGITLILMFSSSIAIYQTVRAQKRNALEIANSLRPLCFSLWGCLIYIYFLRKGFKFLKIISVWSCTKVTYYKPDVTLKRDTFIIAGLILTSGIFENLTLHLEYFTYFDHINGKNMSDPINNRSFLEVYYWRAHDYWGKLMGYNWFLAILGFLQHKWCLYTINYIDAMVAVFARALYFRFKSLCKMAQVKLIGQKHWEQENTKSELCDDHEAWIQAVNDHQNLYRLLVVLEDFFSPIVFASYAFNMFYICVQLFDGLTNDDAVSRSIVHSIYTPWSFIHLVMRALIVSICCARINVYAHKLRDILRQCPIEIYTTEISRVDKTITAGPDIGLTGLGCFTVTKHFILTMFSVVFTFEIVLLQCAPGSTPPPTTTC